MHDRRPKRRVPAGVGQQQPPPAIRQRRAPHFSGAAQQVPAPATDLPDSARRANAAGACGRIVLIYCVDAAPQEKMAVDKWSTRAAYTALSLPLPGQGRQLWW